MVWVDIELLGQEQGDDRTANEGLRDYVDDRM